MAKILMVDDTAHRVLVLMSRDEFLLCFRRPPSADEAEVPPEEADARIRMESAIRRVERAAEILEGKSEP